MNSSLKNHELFEKIISENFDSSPDQKEKNNHLLISSHQAPQFIENTLKRLEQFQLPEQRKMRAQEELLKFGPLEPWINHSELSEIIIQGKDNIWVEIDGRFQKINDSFWHEISFKNIINRILQEAHLRFDKQTPCTQGTWKEFRLQLTSPPITQDITLSLRRQRTQDWSLEEFCSSNWCNEQQKEFLLTLIQEKKNIIVFGETGSGKTSCCNALLKATNNEDRVLLLQENDELILPTPFSLKLFTQMQKEIAVGYFDLQDLVKLSLRLRPQRIVVGEIRGSEAKDYLLALSTGHSGGMTTIHAKSAREALWRLQLLIQMGAPQWNSSILTGLIQQGVDYMIGVENKNEKRKLSSITKLCGFEGSQFLLEPIQC